jgi:hypothetical protein
MAKDPAFPFYAQDFLVDTIRWTRAMQGLHVSLIAESWANDEIIDENGHPAGLGSTDVELWLKIKHKWELVDGKWISPKLEEVRATRLLFRQKQSKKGKLSAQKRTVVQPKHQPKGNSGSTVVEPIESENENEIEDQQKLKEYDRWTDEIIDGNDHLFQNMFNGEMIPSGEHIQHWILDHRDLLNRYPKMRPPNQQAFRKSCLKHIRENYKKQPSGNGKFTNSKQQQTDATADYLKNYYGELASSKPV